MSEDQTTQAVVDKPDVTAQPVTEGANARDDGDNLDNLLKEYDEQAPKKNAESVPEQPGAADDLKVLLEQARGVISEANATKFRHDMDKTIKNIRGELDASVFDDDFVEAWVDAQARKDPRLSKAWLNRNANPKQFEKVQAELGKSFEKRYSKMPDKQATEDREAVTAAVRGASTQAPERKPANYAGMSDSEYRDAVKKEHGFAPL